jgi:saccharopepsin
MFQDRLALENCGSANCKSVNNYFLIGATCVRGENDVFAISPFDGVMGLGFPELGVHGTSPFVAELARQGLLESSKQFFSFYLKGEEGNSGSRFSVGQLDSGSYVGDLVYHDVIPGSKHWSIRLNSISVGGKDIPLLCGAQSCPAVPDTGTSLITAPADVIDRLTEHIGNIKQDCSNIDRLPNIVFKIDQTNYELSPHDYVFKEVGDDGSVSCFEGYYGMNMPPSLGPNSNRMFILGDSFLRRYFSVYDLNRRAVGLAKAA